MSLAMRPNEVNTEVQYDCKGTQLNYEVLSEAVSAVRCSVPLGTNWKKRIDEDFNSRKDGRKQ